MLMKGRTGVCVLPLLFVFETPLAHMFITNAMFLFVYKKYYIHMTSLVLSACWRPTDDPLSSYNMVENCFLFTFVSVRGKILPATRAGQSPFKVMGEQVIPLDWSVGGTNKMHEK